MDLLRMNKWCRLSIKFFEKVIITKIRFSVNHQVNLSHRQVNEINVLHLVENNHLHNSFFFLLLVKQKNDEKQNLFFLFFSSTFF